MIGRLVLPALSLLAAGCAMLPRPPRAVRYYSIAPPAAAATERALHPERVVAVRALDAPPRYRERIFFRREGQAAGFHEFDRWADPPAEIATAVLRRTLQAAGLAAVVADDRLVRRPTHILEGRLTRFDEVQGEGCWTAECEMELVLKRADDGAVVLYSLLAASREASDRATPAVAEAMSAAVAQIAQEAAEALKKALDDDRRDKKN